MAQQPTGGKPKKVSATWFGQSAQRLLRELSADEQGAHEDQRLAISAAMRTVVAAAKTATEAAKTAAEAAQSCVAAAERACSCATKRPAAATAPLGRDKLLRLAGRAEMCAQLLAGTSEEVTIQASALASMREEAKMLREARAHAEQSAAAAEERANRLMVRWERTMMLLDKAKLDKTIAHLHTEVDKEQIKELNNLRALAREHFQSMGHGAMATAMDSLSSLDEVDPNAAERTLERLRAENAFHQSEQLRQASQPT